MDANLFTLKEANRVLPLVCSITRDAVAAYQAAKEAIQQLDRLKSAPQAGLGPNDRAVSRAESHIQGHLAHLHRLTEELGQLGCRLRDYERGVVDFPAACLDAEGFTVYCWALGEAEVRHWHTEHEGFPERRLVSIGAAH